MGYLDNSSITVDAILTKRGRELLSRNDGSFRITQFALGDDEIDYSLFNENHPNGTQYSAEAIENMPLIEAIPNGANIMNSKLITLTRGASAIPYIQLQSSTLSVDRGGTISLNPNTFNLGGNNQSSVEEYIFTILDDRLVDEFIGQGGSAPATAADISEFSSIAQSFSVRGASLSAVATTSNDLFGSTITSRTTSIIIEGVTSGAIKSVALTINK
tara:strand:- start:134 stop:781 length:648 start_codon:yes stop_codon:yes gene_type:complete